MSRTKTPVPACRATDPATIPLRTCGWCSGAGIEPWEESGDIPCMECDSGGYEVVHGDLGATHAYRYGRAFTFNPGTRTFTVTRAKLTTTYRITEFVPDPVPGAECRAFRFEKQGGDEVYSLLVADGRVVGCDCAGNTWKPTVRANWIAPLEERQQFESLGCTHADSCDLLLRAGLLNAE